VLRAVLAALAPDVPAQCYYVQRSGTWDDLALIGVGDPRPAVPSGLAEQYSEFYVFTAPPADCDAVELEQPGSFSASWGGDGDARYVSVGVYPAYDGWASYGYLDSGSAYWRNGAFQFNVSAYGPEGGLGRDVVEGLARALDPDFSSACFVINRELDESELAALGFQAPVAPEGFEIMSSSLTANEAPSGDCGDVPDAEFYPQYNLHWMMESSDGAVIETNASRYPGSEQGPGYIYESGLNWSDSQGTQYSVYGWSKGGSGTIERDILVAVAQSMDPSLDPSTLEEGPIALPAEKPR
jgi:hypothetical protein